MSVVNYFGWSGQCGHKYSNRFVQKRSDLKASNNEINLNIASFSSSSKHIPFSPPSSFFLDTDISSSIIQLWKSHRIPPPFVACPRENGSLSSPTHHPGWYRPIEVAHQPSHPPFYSFWRNSPRSYQAKSELCWFIILKPDSCSNANRWERASLDLRLPLQRLKDG